MLNDISVLYHYCSVDTFIKILSSGALWLTHARTTNDGNEDLAFKNDLKKAINTFHEISDVELNIFNKIHKAYSEKVDFPYICCFSRIKDSLGQWRAYADNGQGVSIGFELGKIPFIDLLGEKHSEDPIVFIDEVSYRDSEIDFMKKILRVSSNIYNESKDIDHTINVTLKALSHLSIFAKHISFSDEEEIRMVYNPCYQHLLSNLAGKDYIHDNHLNIAFRTRGADLISYFEFPFPHDAIKEIVLGPKCNIDFIQLTLLLAQYAPRVRIENNILKSKISYR